MTGWFALAEDSLEAAKSLKDQGRLRSAISRAYYAAYAAFSGVLASQGVTFSSDGTRTNPSHEQLALLVEHNLDRRDFADWDRRNLARRLRDLFRLRLVADYDASTTVDDTFALLALRSSSMVLARVGVGGSR